MTIVNYKTYKIAITQIFAIRTPSNAMKNKPLRNVKLNSQQTAADVISHKQMKVTLTLGIIVGCISNPSALFKVTSWLAWSSSGINPLIYAAMNYDVFFKKRMTACQTT
ncbi:hypothetical protein B4U79_06447 [Dinothrombium tinctorium]|uniref:G-protein coupled receptors family 1 profile domain-containing protein n=1 Tax=Dinothrombium tinctorium TaxID=1965070 RepID=A0A3S3NSE2_9ACAR|nr:hypothetical protein B4U79_14456 [Dinothrombium tinctorium]RWS08666.1 hypothetical protein B4U79_00217 [Dinothrombium tinctorium]RWS10913.1 hypothetical protein B4U79_06447 [Dinothrombium tinctorium]